MLESVNKLVYGMRTHSKYLGGECHRHEKGFRKETMRFRISVTFSSFGMDAPAGLHRQTMVVLPCMCTVVFLLTLMEQTIVTSLYDVTRFPCVIEGGK